MTNDKQAVSVIGLGAMGSALAGALLAAGHSTTVWNRSPAKADDLVARGARHAASADAAIAAAELTILCVVDDRAARAVVDPAAFDGGVLVNLTSGSPTTAREWEQRVGSYVSGGILGTPDAIGTPEALVLYSGDGAAFRRFERTLAVLGRPVWLGPDAGLAPGYDMALLSGMYGLYAGAQHAVTLVASVGGDASAFKEELLVPWLEGVAAFAAGSADPDGHVPQEYNPALQAGSLEHILAASDAQGVREQLTGHLRTALDLMQRSA